MSKRKNVCLICGQEKDGLEVIDDNVFRMIRKINQMLMGIGVVRKSTVKSVKEYRVVICKEDFPKYRKLRESYERRTMLYVGLGVVFTLGLAIVSGPRILGALLYGGFLIVLMYLLGQISYVPKVKMPEIAKDKSMKG